ITLDALAKRGMGGNVHLRVSQFQVSRNFVIETKKNTWNRVWVPLLGRDNKVHLLVKSFKIKSEDGVRELDQQGKVTGIVTNDIHSLGTGERKKLEEFYPGVDFASLPILEQEKSFPGPNRIMLMMAGAVVGVLVGVLGIVLLVIAKRREGRRRQGGEGPPDALAEPRAPRETGGRHHPPQRPPARVRRPLS